VNPDEVRDSLRELVRVIREVLEPVAAAVGDEAIRREVLLALGLDPGEAGRPIDIPPSSLASIDEYRQGAAEDADLQAVYLHRKVIHFQG